MKIFFVTPLFYSIGNAAEEIYWASVRAKLNNQKLVIVRPYKWTEILSYRICNEAIFRIAQEHEESFNLYEKIFILITTFIININFIIKRFLSRYCAKIVNIKLPEAWHFPQVGKNKYWPIYEGNSFSQIYHDPILNNINTTHALSMNQNDFNICSAICRDFGLSDKKFVCLHVRDAGFHRDASRRAYRNAKIETYYQAIRYLLSKGLVVVRMGDDSMQKVDIKDEFFIDYPFSSIKSAAMDLFLIQNCEFYIGMQSGILDVAMMFNKPILTLNMYDWFFNYPLKKIDRGLLKNLSISTNGINKKYSTEEWFDLPFYFTNNKEIYDANISFIDNSETEILKAVVEFHADYEQQFNRQPTESMKKLHEKFCAASSLIMKNDLPRAFNFYDLPNAHKARIALRNLASKGYLYNKFD